MFESSHLLFWGFCGCFCLHVHVATLQFDYDCSGGRWVSVVAANRVLSQMTVSWAGPVDIQNSAAFFLLIKNRVVVNLTTEHKQWHTSLMSCCSSTSARGWYDQSPERQGHACGIRVLRPRTGKPGMRMASGPRFGKIAAMGLGCFLALGVVTALLRLQERQCAPPSSSRSEPAAVSPTVYLPSTQRCLVHGSRQCVGKAAQGRRRPG